MTDTTAFDWQSFLLRWSGEWADSLPDGETRGEYDEAARRARESEPADDGTGRGTGRGEW